MNKIFMLILFLFGNLSVQTYEPISFESCNEDNIIATFVVNDSMKKFSSFRKDTIFDTGRFLYFAPEIKTYFITKSNKISNKYDSTIFKFEGSKCEYKLDTIFIDGVLYYYAFF